MEVTMRKNGDQSADFELPEGCPLCNKELSVRVTPQGAHAVCKHCRWFSQPEIEWRSDGIRMSHAPTVEA